MLLSGYNTIFIINYILTFQGKIICNRTSSSSSLKMRCLSLQINLVVFLVSVSSVTGMKSNKYFPIYLIWLSQKKNCTPLHFENIDFLTPWNFWKCSAWKSTFLSSNFGLPPVQFLYCPLEFSIDILTGGLWIFSFFLKKPICVLRAI